MKKQFKGTLFIFSSALLIASQSILAKLLYGYGFSATTVVMYRFIVGFLVFFLLALFTKKEIFLPKGARLPALWLAALYVVEIALFYQSLNFLPAGTAVLIFYSFPILTAIFAYFINKEKITKEKLFALILATAGLIVFCGTSLDNLTFWGVLLAFGSAVGYALYMVYISRYFKNHQINVITLNVNIFFVASVIYFVISFFTHNMVWLNSPQVYLCVLALGIFATALAMLFSTIGIKMIGPTLAAIMFTVEIPLSAFYAYIAFKDVWHLGQIVGAIILLIAIILPNLFDKDTGLISKREKEGIVK